MLQKSSILKTAEIFFLSPSKECYLMDISRRIGIAHTSVKKSLNMIIKIGIIKESFQKKGSRKFPVYNADYNGKMFKKYKKIYNISSIIESNLIESIENSIMPKSIVLFGSYARGEDFENSDIDLFIECKKETLNLEKFENKLSRKIELHFNEDFSSYSKELKNNIANGIILSGFLEVFK